MEQKVRLELTIEELRALVDMTAIAGTVLRTQNVLADVERPLPHEALAQKIYVLAAETDPESGVAFNEEFQACLETDEYLADGIPTRSIMEFRTEIFWDELVEELAARDIAMSMGDEFFEMNDEERIELMEANCRIYAEEFQEFSLARLRIDENVRYETPDFEFEFEPDDLDPDSVE